MSLLLHVFNTVICRSFEELCGKWQVNKKVEERKAFLITFSLHLVDHDKEEGYRNLDILIYGPMNYVGVWVREHWDVIPTEDLVYNEADDESFVKPGKDYVKGSSPWKRVTYHDSCWRDGVESTLREYAPRIGTIGKPCSKWYELVNPFETLGLTPDNL